jgi:hypothetical protein
MVAVANRGSGGMTSSTDTERSARTFHWLPPVLIGAGLMLGVVLWAKWGFVIAFEAIRSYCFG